ncbi:MAG TPA: dienelactone hydrolase family protein [Firmicutes bacterium]|nr:dienelactone hydrolase family protein [Bacillota bacterium]
MKRGLKVISLLICIIMIFSFASSLGLASAASGESFAALSTAEYYSDEFTNIVMPYRLYVPKNYDASKSYQLIVFLHGAGESGADNISQITNNKLLDTLISDEYIDAHPCIVVVPQSTLGWNSSEIITVMNILRYVEYEYNIDDERQVLIGYSMGGAGLWDMLIRYPDYFDAAVPVAAAGLASGDLESIKDIPIWIFHATNDDTVDVEYSRTMYKELTDIDANVFMTEPSTGGHNDNFVAFSKTALYDWLFSDDFKLPTRPEEKKKAIIFAVIIGAAVLVIAVGTTTAIVVVKRRKAKTLNSDVDKEV